jgi:hypothetical protein
MPLRLISGHEVNRRPHRCAVIPYIGPTSGHRFVDTGMDIDDWHHVYVSEPAVRQMAELVGMVPRGEVKARDTRIAELEEQVGRLVAAVETAERFRQAVDVIESADFRARKKAGRPKEVPSAS